MVIDLRANIIPLEIKQENPFWMYYPTTVDYSFHCTSFLSMSSMGQGHFRGPY